MADFDARVFRWLANNAYEKPDLEKVPEPNSADHLLPHSLTGAIPDGGLEDIQRFKNELYRLVMMRAAENARGIMRNNADGPAAVNQSDDQHRMSVVDIRIIFHNGSFAKHDKNIDKSAFPGVAAIESGIQAEAWGPFAIIAPMPSDSVETLEQCRKLASVESPCSITG